MLHPWDRERTQRDTEPRGVSWLSILFSLLLGFLGIGMAMRLAHGGKGALAVPVVFALMGSVYFLSRGFKGGCCTRPRLEPQDVELQHPGGRPVEGGPQPMAQIVTPPAYGSKPRDTLPLRRVFDRFDLLAIERARAEGLTTSDQGSFLNFARDFVDVDHSLGLLADRDEEELKRHFTASLERALLAFRNPGV